MAKDKDISLKVRPLDDRVVVEPLEAEDKTTGGILLPDSAKQKPQRGRVLAIGPGKLREYIAHRNLREQRVVAALGSREANVDELVADAYADTPPVLWPLATRSLLAHLVKLEHEGRAREVAPGRWSAR